MKQLFKILLTAIVVSMFYFSFEFTFLKGVNTKMMLAAVGIVISVIALLKRKSLDVQWPVVILILTSSLVSAASLLAMAYNGTKDTAYYSYVISALVWLSGALVVCLTIWLAHGRFDIPLLIKYLVGVCVFQCIMAIVIDNNEAVRAFVDSYVAQGQRALQHMDRLYGIGASLDVAGSRFSAVLIMLAFLMDYEKDNLSQGKFALYFMAFIVITVLGSMIARTTYVGVLLAMPLIVLKKGFWTTEIKSHTMRLFVIIALLIVSLYIVGDILYATNDRFHKLIRFAFEGVFRYFEKGELSTSSTETLKTMYIWPDNFKTWLIGDGYFNAPGRNPFYLGSSPRSGFYMGTDAGYCRFIFYFGVVGLAAISLVMIYAAYASAKRQPVYAKMIVFILLANFTVWIKVSTDLFPVFALLFCASMLLSSRGTSDN